MKPVVAGSGQTALIAMKQARERGNPFEIILIDDQMPEMDGFELARQINLIPEFSGIKIIMLTSGGQSGDAERCKSLNILGYLTKPVKQAELIDTIRTVAGTHITHDSQSPLITRHYLRENRRRRHILLAEDNIINQKVAVSLLEKWGHTVMVVNNGKEAYEAVEKQHFDLILMDLFMPVMNGIEAAQVIRKNKSRSHIPIIAMTASCTNDDKKRCHDAGIDNSISKPFQGEELFELIEKTIKKSIEKSSYDDTCDIIDKDLLLNRVNGDKELLKEVVEIFLKEYPSMLFDIEKAIQDNDTHVLQNSLVTIKSLVSNFSAKSAFNTAVKLEIMAACGDLINAEKAYHTLKSEIEQIKEALIIVIKNDNYL
jgi:two-component system sensor histidine kinase/response regulator